MKRPGIRPVDPFLKRIMADVVREHAHARAARRNWQRLNRGRPKPPYASVLQLLRRNHPREVKALLEHTTKTREWMAKSIAAFAKRRHILDQPPPPAPPPDGMISIDTADATLPTSGDCIGDLNSRILRVSDDVRGRGGPVGVEAVGNRGDNSCDLYFSFTSPKTGFANIVVNGWVGGLYAIHYDPVWWANVEAFFRLTMKAKVSSLYKGAIATHSDQKVVNDRYNVDEMVAEMVPFAVGPVSVPVEANSQVTIRVTAAIEADAISNHAHVYADFCGDPYGISIDPVLVYVSP
jgi:hypothetical protein